MRGPGNYPPRPGGPGNYPQRPGGPGGPRPPHATALRPESAQPMPTGPTQRRYQPKPGGGRNAGRKREFEEGNLRERVSKRNMLAEPPPIDREITVAEGVTVKELSEKLGVKANLVVKKLVEKKIFATINQTLDVKLAEELAREFGASTNQVSYEEESTQDIELAEAPADLVRRAPVVTIMGHVDHGKTSLLDAIRETNVAGREAGGITQHIGAYHIERNNRKIVFIDTPGHQAFTRMRARGAKITDIVVLVVSADDGVMPQTLEAIDHARAAGVPIVVAINKIDRPDATPERVKQQLADRGLLAEDWGGDVVMVPVSAKTGQNLDLLLEMILIVADLADLKANPARPAIGNVLEAKLDKGRGPVATMLVRNGTLRVGDFFICGSLFSKVRAMFDDRGNPVREAEPSMPVEVIGLEDLPEVGDSFQVTSDTSKAKQIVIYREAKARDAAMAKGARVATLDSLHRQFKEGDLKDFNLIIKADVGGTAEVLSDTLQALSTDKIRIRVLHAGVGAISESDVLLASTSEAIIVGFNVKPDRSAQAAAEQAKVEIRLHSIIYDLIDEVKLAMTGLLDPVYKETVQGHVDVKEVFKISKVGTVAGCYVSDGLVRRDSQIRVMRDGELIHTGKIEALKRFKNDASEVKNGIECGISLVNFNNILQGDVFEAFTMERIMPELPSKAG
jgi:translation initiation factor IF-2